MENDKQLKYAKILKVTSLFGGVQFLKIIFSFISSKAGAYFLGPTGLGISGLLNSTIGLINQVTKLGVDVTAVKEISYSYKNHEKSKYYRILYLLNRLILFTAITGSILTLVFSKQLSKLTFGNNIYTISFVVLSIAVFFQQLSIGRLSILQGQMQYKILAKANVYIGFVSVSLSVFLYWLYGIDSIIYVITLNSLISFLISYYFERTTNSKLHELYEIQMNFKQFIHESKGIIKLGFLLSLVGLATLTSSYLLKVFLRFFSSIENVGYYQAASVVVNSYIAVIFSVLRTDYFPRLSAVYDNTKAVNETVNQQVNVNLLIITPVIVIFIMFASFFIKLLYTSEFLIISDLLKWTMLGVVFRAVSFSLGYVLLAKNDSNIFLKTTIFFNLFFLIISTICFYFFELKGLGIGYFIHYIIHFLGLIFIVKKYYNVVLEKSSYLLFLKCLSFVIIVKAVSLIDLFYLSISVNLIILVFMFYFVYNELNKLVEIKQILNNFLSKRND